MGEEPAHDAYPACELPPYRALLVVDIKDFSGRRGRHHEQLTRSVPELLKAAFTRCGLAALLGAVCFDGTTGDGFVLGFDAKHLPALVDPFLRGLQEELAYRHRVASGHGGQPVRMRVSINVGPMTDSGGNRLGDGSGAGRVETHRLLDSDAVRHLLDLSTPTITFVAAVVSERTFEDAVAGGFTAVDPELFVEVPVTVKSYQGRAYLYVPLPFGGLLEHGFRPAELQAGAVAGSAGRPLDADGGVRVGGVGNVTGDIRTIVTDARGPVHAGDGSQVIHESGR